MAVDSESMNTPGVGNQIDNSLKIIALYRLPLITHRDEDGNLTFDWDDDSLYLTSEGFRRAIPSETLFWVGILNTSFEIPEEQQASVREELLNNFQCMPLFIPRQTRDSFYHGFCKGILWPLLHTLNNVTDDDGRTLEFDENLWQIYEEVNESFAKAIVSLYRDGCLIWIHDYHLMMCPSYVRKEKSGALIGFFLHTPWPSSESYRMLPVREEILRGLLSSSLIGFNLTDYSRHFVSACLRILNLEEESAQTERESLRKQTIGVYYYGRHVGIQVNHFGINPTRFTSAIQTDSVQRMEAKLRDKLRGRFVLGAIDDLDYIKGISLKLLAFERLLEQTAKYAKEIVMHQVAVPKARATENVRNEINELVTRINNKYGQDGLMPVEYVEEDISFAHRVALYRTTDALFLTPIRDGLNLVPYEYLICTADLPKGQLILSQFIGCSRSLSSANQVNPWSIKNCTDALEQAKQTGRCNDSYDRDTTFVTRHTTEKFAESFLKNLRNANQPLTRMHYLGVGFGPGRLVEFEGLVRLDPTEVANAYRSAHKRLFLLDYDGTLTSSTNSSRLEHAWARPSENALGFLKVLSENARNTVYILSGRTKEILEENFGDFRSLGIAAEHGYYYREPSRTDWKMQQNADEMDLSWFDKVYKIMQSYTRKTDGSYVEKKTVGLVWHYADADRDLVNWQAKDMKNFLTEELKMYPNVQIIEGTGWLQVRLADVNKGSMVERILNSSSMDNLRMPDFILCIGDDKTDEDMFTVLDKMVTSDDTKLFTCSVGIQSSEAKYFLSHSSEVVKTLGRLTMNELRVSASSPEEIQSAIL